MKIFNNQMEQHNYYKPLQRHCQSVNTKTDKLYMSKRMEMESLGLFLEDIYSSVISSNESFSLRGVIIA